VKHTEMSGRLQGPGWRRLIVSLLQCSLQLKLCGRLTWVPNCLGCADMCSWTIASVSSPQLHDSEKSELYKYIKLVSWNRKKRRDCSLSHTTTDK
jgi:hypothetical protein